MAPIRLAHLSDIHFGGENVAAVAAAKEMLNAGGFDLVVVTGDLTRYAEWVEFAAAARWLGEVAAPKLVTPGNHDAPYLAWAERVFAPFKRYEAVIGPPIISVSGWWQATMRTHSAAWSSSQAMAASTWRREIWPFDQFSRGWAPRAVFRPRTAKPPPRCVWAAAGPITAS